MKTLIPVLLALLLVGCGRTQIKVTNNTGSTLSQVNVDIYQSGGGNTKTFTNLASGSTSEAVDWSDDAHLTVKVDASGFNETTDSVTLDAGKTNTLTLTLSGGNIVYVRAAN